MDSGTRSQTNGKGCQIVSLVTLIYPWNVIGFAGAAGAGVAAQPKFREWRLLFGGKH